MYLLRLIFHIAGRSASAGDNSIARFSGTDVAIARLFNIKVE